MAPCRPSAGLRLLALALAVALLATGSLHFHAEDAGAPHWDAASGDALRSSASHPRAPLHMERVDVERAPRCPVCLLRDRSAAIRPDLATVASSRPPAVLHASGFSLAPLDRASAPGRPRGPPLL